MARTSQNSTHLPIEQYVNAVELQGGIYTNYPVVINNTLTADSINQAGSLVVTDKSTSAFAVGQHGATNPTLDINTNTTNAATGLTVIGAAAAAGVALNVISSGTNESGSFSAKGSGTITINPASVLTSGGLASSSLLIGASSLGVYVGTGAPAIASSQGSLYLNNAGGATNTRLYINGGTATNTWVAVTTAS